MRTLIPSPEIVNSKSRNSGKIGTLKDRDGSMVSDDEGVGNVLNNFFAEVFSKEDLLGLSSSGGIVGVRGGIHNLELSEIQFTKKQLHEKFSC